MVSEFYFLVCYFLCVVSLRELLVFSLQNFDTYNESSSSEYKLHLSARRINSGVSLMLIDLLVHIK